MTRSTAAATTPATGTVTIRLADHDFDSLATALRDAIAQLPEGILLDGRGGAPVVNDPPEILRLFGTGAGREAVRDWATRRGAVLRALETCGVPVACIWSGPAFGPGWEIMLAAHTRFLDGEAKSSAPRDLTLGLLPGAGAVQRLARILGVETASSLLMGKPLDGAALATAGLWTGCETGTAETAAKDWLAAAGQTAQPWDGRRYRLPGGTGATAPHAAKSFALPAIAARGRGHDCDPAPLATLRALYEGSQLPMDAALAREAQLTAEVLTAGVATSRIRTFVVNKARAEEGAARPDAPRREVRKLGVLGAGMMGAGIARAAAEQGIDVILLDRDRDSADRGRSGVAKALEKAVARGRETDKTANATLSRIHPTADQSDLAGADLVIEAVFEQTDLKREVTQSVLPHLAEDAIVASNTSTISIDTLAGALPDPGRFIGLHFFSPVDRMPLVEIIKGRDTSDETLAAALDFTMQLGKTPIVVNTSPGFFTSRIFCTYIDEAMAMLAEGVAPSLIENAARMIGAPTGPLAVTDEVSLDLQKKVIDQAEADGLDAVDDALVLDDEHRVTPIDRGDVCLNYDKAAFDESGTPVPETLADLTDDAYAGQLVVEDPATSSPGLSFLLATVAEFGEDGWQDFWEGLVANDVAVSAGWEDAYYGRFSGSAGSEGDRPLVVSYASSPPAEVLFAEEDLDEAPTGVIEASCFQQVEFAGVLAGTDAPDAARQLVDFMLSKEFQADIPLQMFVFPARGDVELPQEFTEHTVVPDDPVTMDPATIDANREQWIEQWDAIVNR